MLRLYTFGGLRVEHEGEFLRLPTRKARQLLAYLITARDCPHSRSVLVGVLWPDLPEGKARRRLSDTLWRIRHVLGDHVLANEEHVWLNDDLPRWSDVVEFCHAVSHLRRDQPGTKALEEALALYHGPYLDGLDYDWVLLEQERLRGLYLEALGYLLERHKRAGDYHAALQVARRLVTVEPLHEAAHRELMRLYHLLGRDAEAMEQYQRCRELLRKELDVLPAPETEKLYQVLHRRASPVTVRSEIHLPTLARAPLRDLNVPPLVGRDVERAALLDHLESAARGHGELLLLEGEPGIGKSRLVEETIAGARWRNIDTIRAETEADNSSSYGPLLAVLSQELTPLRLRQLGQIVAPDVLWALSPLLPGISARQEDPSPLADLPPPEAHARLQRALVTVILGLSRIKPRLWVLEDIQWIDAETLTLLPRLYPALVESRTLLLITGRCAELRARPVVWDMLQALDKARPFPRYTLSHLGKDAIIDLLERLLDEDSTGLAERLLQESGGVPLYIVEILKAWRDEGCLLPTERGRWRWEGKPPERLSIHLGKKIIDRRLTRLSPDAEAVLKSAAVIGTEVDFDLLADVCALSEAGPDATRPERYLRATDELLGLGFLSETEVGYRFSHEQIRHVVHDRLSIAERQGLHHRVAVSLEEHHPEEFRALARHFAIAGLRPPALHYLNKAVEQARAVFAHRTALTCYQDLLALLIHPEDHATRYDVLGGRAEVLGWIGDRDVQGHDLEEMLHLARELSDEARVASALHRRSEWHRIQGRYEAAQEDARAALVIYERLGDEKGQAALLSQLGRNLLDAENDSEAIRCLQKALPIHEAADDLVGQIWCLMGLARAAQNQGDLSQAQNYCERSLALAKATQDPRWISYTLSSVGLGYVDLGDMDAAETYLRQALDLAKRSQGRRRVAITHVRLAHVALQCGDFEVAHHRLRSALQTLRDVQDVSWEGYALSLLGEIDLLRGKIIVAKESLETAYQHHQALGEHDYAAIDLSYLALVELALGNEETAWQYSQEVITKARAEWPGTTCPPEVCYNHFRVAEATRRWGAARASLEQAARVLNERATLISDPEWRDRYRIGLRVNRAINEAMALQPSAGQLRVRLARADVPAHRRPEPDETIVVIWTVDAGEQDTTLAKREGKVALRRYRILRLLDEAQAQDALPTAADLAGALDVSARTIRSDLAALREQGHTVTTRGSRT